ncbi:MAG: DNA-3-methyladenine glycosylase I [Firmicutes bacterium]|nr:DNA-3-methyladenine glycosylase I [Bacillota bacterium]
MQAMIDETSVWRGSDAQFLELLTKVIFCTGFRPAVVERRWTAFRQAFCDFDIDAVACFDEVMTEQLLTQEKGIIRNVRKVQATVSNAMICKWLIEKYESMENFVLSLYLGGEQEACLVLRTTFNQVGESAARSMYRALMAAQSEVSFV